MSVHLALDSVHSSPFARAAQPTPGRGRYAERLATVAPVRREAGERRLLLAVLEDGLRILLDHGARARRTPRLDELDWLSSDDRSHPFAFLSICETLDIDADRLRRCVYEACRVTGLLLLLLLTFGAPAARAEAVRPVAPGTVCAASWYGPGFATRPTASGVRFDPSGFTAAHRTLPLGTHVRVTNLQNGRSVDVEINDRGPYVRSRGIDLSLGAARCLGMVRRGVARVRIEVL